MNIKVKAAFILLLGTFFWGASFMWVKNALNYTDVYSFIAIRFFISSVVLAPILFFRKLENTKHTLKNGAILSIPFIIGFLTQTIGLQYTTATRAAFITGMAVVIVPVIVSLQEKKVPKLLYLFSVLLSGIGLYFLTVTEKIKFEVGDVWVLVCAFAFAYHLILVGKRTHGVDAFLITLVQIVFLGSLSFLIAFLMGTFHLPKNIDFWMYSSLAGIFSTCFMLVAQNHYQKFISPIQAVLIFSLEPLFASILAYFYLDEIFTQRMFFGAILVFSGMILSEIKIKKRRL